MLLEWCFHGFSSFSAKRKIILRKKMKKENFLCEVVFLLYWTLWQTSLRIYDLKNTSHFLSLSHKHTHIQIEGKRKREGGRERERERHTIYYTNEKTCLTKFKPNCNILLYCLLHGELWFRSSYIGLSWHYYFKKLTNVGA